MKKEALIILLITVPLTLVGLGFAAMSTNPPFVVQDWVPMVFFVAAGLSAMVLGIHLFQAKHKVSDDKIEPQATQLFNNSSTGQIIDTEAHDKLIDALIDARTAAKGLLALKEDGKFGATSSIATGFVEAERKYNSAIKLLKQETPRKNALINSLKDGASMSVRCIRRGNMDELKADLERNSRDIIKRVTEITDTDITTASG